MKVLMIHHSSIMGGGTLSCFDIIEALREDKHNVVLSLPPRKGEAEKIAKKMDINLLNKNISPMTFGYYNGSSSFIKQSMKFISKMKNWRKWKSVIRHEKPDLVLLNSMVLWPLIPLLNSMKIKNIIFVRETMKGNPNGIINRMISANIEKASGVAFLSHFDKKQWNLSGRVKQSIIPDVVDIDKFSNGVDKESSRNKLKLKKNVFYILYVGGMNELKGVRTIIHAMNHCKSKNIQLLFLGDLGSKLKELKGLSKIKSKQRIALVEEINRYVKENKLEKQIQFVGMQKQMNVWYSACDVVVFPAKKAHQARPIYEAGVFKKPIIASNFQNYMEYLIPGTSGLVFEPGNYEELAQVIDRLYIDPVLSNELGENNYKLMEKCHDSKEINKKIKNFIVDVSLTKIEDDSIEKK